MFRSVEGKSNSRISGPRKMYPFEETILTEFREPNNVEAYREQSFLNNNKEENLF